MKRVIYENSYGTKIDEQGRTFSVASHEDLVEVLDHQIDIIDKIGRYLGQNYRVNQGPAWVGQAIAALAKNKEQLERYKTQKTGNKR